MPARHWIHERHRMGHLEQESHRAMLHLSSTAPNQHEPVLTADIMDVMGPKTQSGSWDLQLQQTLAAQGISFWISRSWNHHLMTSFPTYAAQAALMLEQGTAATFVDGFQWIWIWFEWIWMDSIDERYAEIRLQVLHCRWSWGPPWYWGSWCSSFAVLAGGTVEV